MAFLHTAVFLKEAVNFLNVKPSGVYVDSTAGGGGHSEEILKNLNQKGKLILLDQDPDAIVHLKKKFEGMNNVFIFNENFCNIAKVLDSLNIIYVDGFLFDLGVSSYQLDTEDRGFSYKKNAPLDMRMKKVGPSAKDFVNSVSEGELYRVISDYGEEKFAFSIAKNIVKSRENKEIETTFELVDIIKNSMPQKFLRNKGHPAKRTFQAIRIYVNSELDALKKGLEGAFSRLSSAGRMSVITFHSLEDRIVKHKFASFSRGCTCPKDFPVCVCNNKPKARLVLKKAMVPSSEEIARNSRSKSAKLRVCEKI